MLPTLLCQIYSFCIIHSSPVCSINQIIFCKNLWQMEFTVAVKHGTWRRSWLNVVKKRKKKWLVGNFAACNPHYVPASENVFHQFAWDCTCKLLYKIGHLNSHPDFQCIFQSYTIHISYCVTDEWISNLGYQMIKGYGLRQIAFNTHKHV